MHLTDELLDIVDLEDRVIGQKYRTDIYSENLSNFRVINAFLINSKKEIWIPRRSPHKKLFPLCLDASVGGHVAAGETYDQAFARELQEELALSVLEVSHRLLTRLTPHEHGVSAFMHFYLIFSNQTPEYNPNDFVSAEWYSLQELHSLVQAGEPMKGDLPQLIEIAGTQMFAEDRLLN